MNRSPAISGAARSAHKDAVRIDAHHHLWRYRADQFGWITDEMAALRRDFLLEDLRGEIESAGIEGTVVVQACESIEETQWLLECAQTTTLLRGVVGWAPLDHDDLPALLSRLDGATKLVGIREVVQGKADGYLDRPEFSRGMRQLTALNLTYDILIHENQLSEAIRLVDKHPYQRFVLDHAAKPKIAKQELEPWSTHCKDLAQRPNVSCKISGMVTEADWQHWTETSLRPYLDVCVDAFEPSRLLAGSDWPVCLVASSYSRWWNVLANYFRDFSAYERQQVFGRNAQQVYRLPDPHEVSS